MAALIALVPVSLAVGLVIGPAARQGGQSVAISGPAYTLVQMNLCLSGRAGCFPRVEYPRGVEAAADLIRDGGADVVTLSEVCRADVEEMAAELAFQVRFTAVSSYRLPDDCIDPGGRGVFGIAVLTKAAITASVERPYATQSDLEQRRWLCVTTHEATVCTTHLEIRGRGRLDAVNDAQCVEFGQALRRLGTDRPVIAGGDLNRATDCAAPGMWVGTDNDAVQLPGSQHVYATTDFVGPRSRIVGMEYTDHDALVVTGHLEQ